MAMNESVSTIAALLETGAGNHPAISAPGGVPLTYDGLCSLVADTVKTLRSRGIRPNDRVAYVLDNGPEAATTFLSVAAGATAAPLNPAYRADEYEFYLADLGAKLLIVAQGKNSPSIDVAAKLGVPVARLVAHPERGAGTFSLEFDARESASGSTGTDFAEPDDVALVLHTSGTTSRPKIVPLTHRNVCASARNVRQTLALTPDDRNLSIMPLFHIHGLIASLLAPLSAGAEVCCTPGFNALKFFGWMAEVKPTWYTAVPTMHQAILARASKNADVVAESRLRFIRSSSSALPLTVIAELERVFRAPVVEAYGMTEAAHQMASNPLPPRARKPGTVGIAAGPEIGIMDPRGTLLPPGEIGEVVIRGDNVTAGYASNPQANAEAFTNGWFRTGDQGRLDADGYLALTGRLKEIINRGGEKIAPREVDDVLMDHPAVAQVVTFALPDEMLGEEVVAAIVLQDGKAATEHELRTFAATRLADFKVPRKIVFLPEIPRGATGKLQRIGLAQRLGLTG